MKSGDRRKSVVVRVAWKTKHRPLATRDVRRAVSKALEHGGRGAIEIDVVFVDDATLAGLHARFLGDSAPTDVLAFDLGDEHGAAGEIWASVDCARRVARERGVATARELALYVVHGALHLCGFDDHRSVDRKRMRAAEATVMEALGYARDLGPHP